MTASILEMRLCFRCLRFREPTSHDSGENTVKLISIIAAAALAGGLAPAAAQSAPADDKVTQATTPTQQKFVVKFSSDRAKVAARKSSSTAALDITCEGVPESPHYSYGSAQGRGSVIAKARVRCFGSAGTVRVSFNGRLGSIAGGKCSPNTYVAGPPSPSWSGSTGVQTVWSNGKERTFYLPPSTNTTRRASTRTWVASSQMVADGQTDGWRERRRFTGVNCR